MTHGSLFSGIGGFDLAAEWMGWENIFHCEWNEFGQKVLKYYWPDATSYTDITKTDFSIHRGTIDILTGGFPCQPFSQAGLRKGKEDERHLWPEMLRAIREIQPRYVVGENVPGLVNWSKGLVFEQVHTDLEAAGYEVQSFILPACGTDAPHKRERVWFLANATSSRQPWSRRRYQRVEGNENNKTIRANVFSEIKGLHKIRIATNSVNERFEITRDKIGVSNKEVKEIASINRRNKTYDWDAWPTQSPVCTGDDGVSSKLDGITFPKWRNESIKGAGNAIVPQIAHMIFKAIQEYETLL